MRARTGTSEPESGHTPPYRLCHRSHSYIMKQEAKNTCVRSALEIGYVFQALPVQYQRPHILEEMLIDTHLFPQPLEQILFLYLIN